MATKCTMLIQTGTVLSTGKPGRLGGFSESWYTNRVFDASLVTAFFQLCQVRAALLPQTSTIVGARFQQTDGYTSGASESVNVNLPGTSGILTDSPQMALKIQINASASANKKLIILRSLPDAIVVTGEYAPSTAFNTALQNFVTTLGVGQWCWRGQQLDATAVPVLTIGADGTYFTSQPSTLASGNLVKVLRTRNAAGRQKGGLYSINVTGPSSGVIVGWNHGVCTGGRLRKYNIIFPQAPTSGPLNYGTPQCIVKKVGRPFNQYRGRKSVRSPG